MATADEKAAKQQARDVARAEITQGRQRLATVGKAAAAFPERRLRSSGDLSRYAIGGFLSDALPPIGSQPKPSGGGKPKGGVTTTTTRKPSTTKTTGTTGTTGTLPVVRATPGRGVRTSGLLGANEAAYINRSVGIVPTTGAARATATTAKPKATTTAAGGGRAPKKL